MGAGGGDPMKNVTLALLVVAGIAIGITGVIAGGIDDSPGAQLLSLLFVIGTVLLGVRALRRRRAG